METLRECTKCGIIATNVDELSLFVFNKQCKHNRRKVCIKCNNTYKRQWDSDNRTEDVKEKKRASYIKYKYKVSLDTYDCHMQSSDICEVCGENKELCYDHNHATGEFRGVLCRACNRALGSFRDSKTIMLQAIKYLELKGSYSKDKNDFPKEV